jgi:hypothetical protein
VVVPGAPDEVRPQGDRRERRPVGREHLTLGEGLRLGIRRVELLGIRRRVVHALEVAATPAAREEVAAASIFEEKEEE